MEKKVESKRLELQDIFETVLGSKNVYFQPPESIKIKYPCIIYTRTGSYTAHADNKLYRFKKKYQISYITKDPDDLIPDSIEKLPLCKFDRHYVSNNLHHYVFNLFY